MEDFEKKYLARARLTAKLLAYTPFLRLAGLNGSLVTGNATRLSDIDFLIIAKPGRLYTTRFFATLLIGLTGYRRHGRKIAGRVCLNCYLSSKDPNILPQNKKNNGRVARAYKYMIPLVDDGVTATKFFASNKWMFNSKFKIFNLNSNLKPKFKNFPIKPKRKLEKTLGGKFGDWAEAKLVSYQTKRILAGKKPGDEIYLTDQEIRLHPKKH